LCKLVGIEAVGGAAKLVDDSGSVLVGERAMQLARLDANVHVSHDRSRK
jgi:hypothetical protein